MAIIVTARKMPNIIVIGNSISDGILNRVIEENLNSKNINFKLVSGLAFYDAIKIAKEYKGPADAVISGSSIVPELKQRFNVPIVEIRIDGIDLLEAILKFHSRSPNDVIVICIYGAPKPVLDDLARVAHLQIKQVIYNNLDEIKSRMEEIAHAGVKSIIATTLPCLLARDYGIEGIPFYSQAALNANLEEAVQLAYLHRCQTDFSDQLQVVGDCSLQGIIGTNIVGRVTFVNSTACNILGDKPCMIVGESIMKILPGFELVCDSSQWRPQKLNLQGKELLVIVKPISASSSATGFILSIQENIDVTPQLGIKSHRERTKSNFTAQWTLNDILGASNQIYNVKNKAALFSNSDFPVLITGETGVGKELFAQGMHNASLRAHRPFISINCASLPETLLESELFGYEEGSFTGGKKGGKEGLLELANTGTLFLDEIGDLSASAQAKLLRVLEENEMFRIGGRNLVPINIRIIAATNKNLECEVNEGHFRSDLYYRISVLRIEVPPLRERLEDIPELFEHFLLSGSQRNEARLQEIMLKVLPKIQILDWPGNVRQLKAFTERLVIFVAAGLLNDEMLNNLVDEVKNANPILNKKPTHRTINELECQIHPLQRMYNLSPDVVREALVTVGGSKSRAGELLGVSRVTIWRKLRSCNSSNTQAANMH